MEMWQQERSPQTGKGQVRSVRHGELYRQGKREGQVRKEMEQFTEPHAAENQSGSLKASGSRGQL